MLLTTVFVKVFTLRNESILLLHRMAVFLKLTEKS